MKGGLLKTPKDNRDFSLKKVFGAVVELPKEDFIVAEPLKIKNQYETDMCAAFACSAVSEDQEGIELNPEWFFSRIKQKQGSWASWGADLRTTCKVAVESGFIKHKDFPTEWRQDYQGRDFFANWDNWPDELETKAKIHRKKSYFKADGSLDNFDNLRAVMWQNRAYKRSIFTGVIWRQGWEQSKNGIIPNFPSTPMFGHALKIFGQKIIQHEPYLVAQLSNGTKIGDKGIFYFSRGVINRDFTYGAYMFVDMSPEEARKKSWTCWQKLCYSIRNYFNDLIK